MMTECIDPSVTMPSKPANNDPEPSHLNTTLPISITLLLLSGAVSAQSFYVGAAVGAGLADESPSRAIKRFDTDSSWRIHAGWQFNDALALEASYHDFGTANGQLSACDGPCPATDIPLNRRTETTAWSVRMAYFFGQHSLQPFAAVGVAFSDTELSTIGLGSGTPVRANNSDQGLTAELGARWRLGKGFSLRAGYEWFDLPVANGGAFNLGAEYSF